MSHSVLQDIGLGMLANVIPDPGAGGTVRVGDAGISVCVISVASNARILANATTPGQILLLVNTSGGARSAITDSASALSLTISTGRVAICVYTGISTAPWVAVVLPSGSVT
jgi:hypothetical protein